MTVYHYDTMEKVLILLGKLHPFSDLGVEGVYNKLREFDETQLFKLLQEIVKSERREWMIAAHTMINLNHEKSIPILIPLLRHPNREYRWEICGLLSLHRDERVIGPFMERLKDEDPGIRHIAAFALGKVGDLKALPALEWTIQNDTGVDYEGRLVSEMAKMAIRQIKTRSENP